jgi:uncharacterized protein (TIGR02453 family)
MSYFSPAYLQFFQDLAANNNRDWFNDNRKLYETEVKKPFAAFIKDVVSELTKLDPSIQVEPKNAIFRINRDIRFSKDKTPYNKHNSAILSPLGRKDYEHPGMYIMFSREKAMIGGGAYAIGKENLFFLREYIVKHQKGFHNLLSDKSFTKYYGEIRGERNKILPKEFKEAAIDIPELFNKQFYFMADLPAKIVYDKNLISKVVDHWKAGNPIRQFLIKGLHSA